MSPNGVLTLEDKSGVGAATIPWNAPLVFFSKKLAPALAAGNTMLVKTSEKAPLSCHYVSTLLQEAGFPPGVVNVLHGHGATSGNAIASHMDIRALSFTGSVRTGRLIQKAAALSNFKHLTFELGGKSPAVVFEDADVDTAARETSMSIMWHSGQTCMASSRVYVHASIAQRFIETFKEAVGKRKLGDPTISGVDNGPLADGAQYETVLKYIAEGEKTSGQHDGQDGKSTPLSLPAENADLFVTPTIFLQQPGDSKIMREEVFGPVVCINTFETEEEALAAANDTEYGLYASVYTKDIDRAIRFAKGFESGMVGVNCTSPTGAWDMPFGGYKQSGTGRESLVGSLDDWLEQKSVYIKVAGLSDVSSKEGRASIIGR